MTQRWLTPLLLVATLCAQDPNDLRAIDSDYLSPWRTLGPVSALPRKASKLVDERAPDLDRVLTLPNGERLEWTSLPESRVDERAVEIDFDQPQQIAYLYRHIRTLVTHRATLEVDTDVTAAMWINGSQVWSVTAGIHAVAGNHRVSVKLDKGLNTVLVKLTSPDGEPTTFEFGLEHRLSQGSRWGAGLPDDGIDCYRIEEVPVPDELHMEVGGLAFAPDGSLFVCCRRGDVYRVAHPEATTADGLGVTTFATGLHEPLGLLRDDDGSLLVAQKPELTRLTDRDGDGRADTFSTVATGWGMSGNYHEFHYGPVRDPQGNLWGTLNVGFPCGDGPERLFRGAAYRVTPAGTLQPVCYGLRSPNGLLVNDDGKVFFTDNQGEWMPACCLAQARPRAFYGHIDSVAWALEMPGVRWETQRSLPAVWIPYHLQRSTSWPVMIHTADRFGPYEDQILVGDQTNANLIRITLDQVGTVYQGACYPFWQGFAGGINRLAFDRDGVLYVGFTSRGWGSSAPRPGGLQRLRYLGPEPFDLLAVHATHDGFTLEFTKPLGSTVILDATAFHVREYGYQFWANYGSPELGNRDVAVRAVTIAGDRRSLHLTTAPRNPGRVFHIRLPDSVVSQDGDPPLAREAFYTLVVLP